VELPSGGRQQEVGAASSLAGGWRGRGQQRRRKETPLGPVRHGRENRGDNGGGSARTEERLASAEAGEARPVAAEPGAVRGGTTEVPVQQHEAWRRGGGGWLSRPEIHEPEFLS
uniref:Uncharacterized protein n=1 Tax=Oryza glaberrima TaxID=4538 RepID=I1QLX5_ORYGL